ncbi:hypothetical protein PV327_010017 [Microctonus hyperodae]|uniref:Uncharacterized protein n=1 Tax=Microctonus hyperodae TaxID=165561 RepID=A0AA39KGB3_MICHY|nr:hypothetical protein PV327_010017 [Microctonus hyperodae]
MEHDLHKHNSRDEGSNNDNESYEVSETVNNTNPDDTNNGKVEIQMEKISTQTSGLNRQPTEKVRVVKNKEGFIIEKYDIGKEKKIYEEKNKMGRFKSIHVGEIVVTAKLNPVKCTTRRTRNQWRILDKIKENNIMPIKMTEAGFNIIDVQFDSVIKVNKCLDIDSSLPREEQTVWFEKREKKKFRNGVITDWDMSLKKFSTALDLENNIESAEIMQKRVFDKENKTFVWKDTKNIIITTQGNYLPTELKLYGGLTT